MNANIDFETLLQQVDLSPADLEDPEHRIPLSGVAETLELVASPVGNEAFGLELGLNILPAAPVCFAMPS